MYISRSFVEIKKVRWSTTLRLQCKSTILATMLTVSVSAAQQSSRLCRQSYLNLNLKSSIIKKISSSSYICSKRQHTAKEKLVSRTDMHEVHLHLPLWYKYSRTNWIQLNQDNSTYYMEFTRKDYGYKQCNLDSELTTKTSQTA